MSDVLLPWQHQLWDILYAARGKLPHAFLLVGSRGIGKLVFARALAKGLLCEKPHQNGMACGSCVACGWFMEGSHPDFLLISPEAEHPSEDAPTKKPVSTTIKISQIRALGEFLSLSAHQSGKRIVIISPADAMNAAASNALLKNLEEPPPSTLFILVAQHAQRLLPTLRSRCQLVTVNLPDKASSLRWLEDQNIENAPLLLAQAGNAPLLALEMHDESYLAGRAKFLGSLSKLTPQKALEMAEQFSKFNLSWTVDWLQKWTYDLVCLKCGDEIRYNLDLVNELKGIASEMSTLALIRYNQRLVETRRLVSHPLNSQLVLETSLFAYLDLKESEQAHV